MRELLTTALVAFVAFGILYLTSPNAAPVHASGWICPSTPEEKWEFYDSIFTGTPTAVEPAPDAERERVSTADKPSIILTFDVQKIWKGKNQKTLTIEGHSFGFDRFTPTIGKTYLIYAFARGAEHTDYRSDFDCNNLWYTGHAYLTADGIRYVAVLPDDLKAWGPGRTAGQPSSPMIALVVLAAAVVFVVAARFLFLWRWPFRPN